MLFMTHSVLYIIPLRSCARLAAFACAVLSLVSIQMQSLAFLAVFVYATHATQAIAFEWKPGFSVGLLSDRQLGGCVTRSRLL